MQHQVRFPLLLVFTCVCLIGAMPTQVANAQSFADLAKPIEGRSMRASSAARLGPDGKGDPDPDSNADRHKNIKPGTTKVLMDVKGPGVVTHMWFTFLGPAPHKWSKDGSANHQEMLLRIYYDGSDKPGVETPVGDFFANSFGKRSEVISAPVVVEDADSYNCFWHMPFRKSCRIEIVNQSKKNIGRFYFNIDWIKKKSMPKDTPYFYAQYRQEYPVVQGKDYTILETEGKGHYVGTVLSVRSRSPSWFGEGDEKIYIDGEKKASIWGTGTEDYFLSAWGLKMVNTPFFGTPYFNQHGIVGGQTSAYRWHLQDPLVFNTKIKVTIEHWGWISPDENKDYRSSSWNERQDDFSSVAYWYQTGKPTFTARAPSAAERTLPNIEKQIVYANKTKFKNGIGKASAQKVKSLIYKDGHLLYKPTSKENAWIEIPFEIKEKEPVRLLLNATRSYDFGKYRATLNGVRIGKDLDFYNKTTDNWEFHLLDFWPEPGKYTLRLECIGKNSASTQHWLGLESVRLRERRPRVKEWAFDKDKDWTKNPILYR